MKRTLSAVACLLAMIAAFTAFVKLKTLSEGDPDRYYHIALSKLTYEAGRPFLRALPQVDNLGWGNYFLDKEFLFHQVTTLAYAVAGERGVIESSFLCSVLALIAFFLFALRRIPLAAASAVSVAVFSSPFLAFRLSLLRPHTLAVLTFVLLNIAVLSRRPRLTALTALLFTLSYHAFYVPLLVMALLYALSYVDEATVAREWRRTAAYGIFGCIAGILANPYFPGNLVLAAIHARIPELMQGELKGVSFGEELVPVRADQFFEIFHGCLLVLFAATFFLGVDRASPSPQSRSFRVRALYLLGVAAFFLVVSFQITRAGEYLIPACGFLLLLFFERWPARWKMASSILAALAVAQILFLGHLVRERVHQDGAERVRETFKAIAAIPPEPKGVKVFNCEWDRTPYLLYARPDLKFVDILDPSLLYFADSGAFRAREEVRNGVAADISGLLRNAFHSEYVLCGDPSVTAHLRADPGLQQLYPPLQVPGQPTIVLSLFRVLDSPVPEFVRTLRVTTPETVDEAKLAQLGPPGTDRERKILDLEKTPFLNLAAFQNASRKEKDVQGVGCSFVSASPEEQRRLAGARFLGLGGGQGFKVWRNGQPLFTSRAGFPSSRTIQAFVPLDPPLRADDRIEALVCSSPAAPFWGVALSFWTAARIEDQCKQKSSLLLPSSLERAGWNYQGLQAQTCLAPLAAPAARRELSQPSAASQKAKASNP